MPKPPSNTAAKLAKKWHLNVKHALYRKTGDWYHQLERFPGALLDEEGFVIFETESAFRECPQLRIRQDVAVPEGISKIPGYARVTPENLGTQQQTASYDKAIAIEGKRYDVIQSVPERNRTLRMRCLKAHGCVCSVCGFDFAKRYGAHGEGFIHVHHLKLLAAGEQLVNPVTDLRPVCPNCHAMIHRSNPPLTIEELKLLLI